MKKALCLVALLGLVASASAAEGRIFITAGTEPYGLTKPENACRPTFSTVDINNNNYNAYDYYYGHFEVSQFPPGNHPGYTCSQPLVIDCNDPQAPKYAYIWLQFDPSIAKNRKINGLEITSYYCATNQPTTGSHGVYYLCNDAQGNSGRKRWDGTATPPNYPEFTGNNAQILVAIDAYGIRKHHFELPDQLYTGSTTGPYIALLGAICCGTTCDAVPRYLKITKINYSDGAGNPAEWGFQTAYVCIPEPASLLLLSLAGLMVRRR